MSLGINQDQLAELVSTHEDHIMNLLRSSDDVQCRLEALNAKLEELERKVEDLERDRT